MDGICLFVGIFLKVANIASRYKYAYNNLVTVLVFELKHFKVKLRVFLTGCIVAVVTYY